MKQPFCMQPWDSSPKIVKKLFKVIWVHICHSSFLKAHMFGDKVIVTTSTMIMSSMCGSRSDSMFMKYFLLPLRLYLVKL
ncbi:uncharacterized protein LOC109948260 isoform X2 [Prunus persica]|uniref:uncharacterized protein LOC109948260 isoform X2 n=1 Tax=Prunus persica TaxID=3760 RepID=UPI0009AB9F28|nr:uncharacterized protein LOC109948260 isoform X2 [Prunus persica]